jgi:hypothetical protein
MSNQQAQVVRMVLQVHLGEEAWTGVGRRSSP